MSNLLDDDWCASVEAQCLDATDEAVRHGRPFDLAERISPQALDAMRDALAANPQPLLDDEGKPLDIEEFLTRRVWFGPPGWYARPRVGMKYPGKGRGRPAKQYNPYERDAEWRKGEFQRKVRLPRQARARRVDALHDEILRILDGLLHREPPLKSVRKYALAVERELIKFDASYATIERTVTAALHGLIDRSHDLSPKVTAALRNLRRKG